MTMPAPIRSRWRAALCLLPPLAVAVGLAVDAHDGRERQLRHETLLTSRYLVAAIDRELGAATTALEVMAGGRALADDDLPTLYRQALDVVSAHQIVNNIVLADRAGQQRLNTLTPWGSALPTRARAGQLLTIFETRQPAVTDLFTGPVTGTHLVAVGVPVARGSEVVYTLSAGISPDRIGQVMKRLTFPDEWIAVAVDGQGRVVARTREAQRYVGQPAAAELLTRLRQPDREGTVDLTTLEGIPVIGAFARSRHSNWVVAVGAPRAALWRKALPALAWIVAAVAASAAIGWRLRRRGA